MITLLIFLFILFALFGVVNLEYTKKYRQAYEMWVKHIVFSRNIYPAENLEIFSQNKDSSRINKIEAEMCNKDVYIKVESLSRQICRMNDIYFIVLYSLFLTSAVMFITVAYEWVTIYELYNFVELNSSNILQYQSIVESILSLILTCIIIIAAYFLTRLNHLQQKSGTIDEKLFQVWWKYKRPNHKNEYSRSKMEPRLFHNIHAKDIKDNAIKDASDEANRL